VAAVENLRKKRNLSSCRISRPLLHSLRSWAVFEGPIRGANHRLKQRRDFGLGDAFSSHLVSFMKTLDWTVDPFDPVPFSNKRDKERGYNQMGWVAHPFSLQMGRVYSSRILVRKTHTLPQVGLSAEERRTWRELLGLIPKRLMENQFCLWRRSPQAGRHAPPQPPRWLRLGLHKDRH
jgi:predicted amidophosphoribosyltransferase